jgi:hypothetical protein
MIDSKVKRSLLRDRLAQQLAKCYIVRDPGMGSWHDHSNITTSLAGFVHIAFKIEESTASGRLTD